MRQREDRLAELFRRHADDIHTYAAWRAGGQDAADVVSEVFLVAWQALDRLRAGEERGWLFGVARKVVLARRRQGASDQQALPDWATGKIQSRMGYAPGSEQGNRLLFDTLGRMLLDTPAAPAVRASAFRILADLPGVLGLGSVKDDNGRSGQGVEFISGPDTEVLIVDAGSDLLLEAKHTSVANGASAAVPTKEQATLVLTAEWSNATPQVPTLP